jgi:hypothetical protein
MRISVVSGLALVVVLVGSCAATKDLNETSGRAILRERLQKEKYMLPLAGILPLMKQTQKDYTSGSVTGQEAVLKTLLERKLVVQHSQILAYPKISGLFSERKLHTPKVFNPAGRDDFLIENYKLEMVPNSNIVSGEFEVIADPPPTNRSSVLLHMKVKGTVNIDGSVDMRPEDDPVGWRTGRFMYHEEGNIAYLRHGRPGNENLVGKATGQKLELKFYEYAFSPEMEKQILRTSQGSYVPVGNFEVGEISGLRLLIETEAAGQFTWRVSLNDIGRVLVGAGQPHGKGEVVFGKKPDGSWFVDRVAFDGYVPPTQ